MHTKTGMKPVCIPVPSNHTYKAEKHEGKFSGFLREFLLFQLGELKLVIELELLAQIFMLPSYSTNMLQAKFMECKLDMKLLDCAF